MRHAALNEKEEGRGRQSMAKGGREALWGMLPSMFGGEGHRGGGSGRQGRVRGVAGMLPILLTPTSPPALPGQGLHRVRGLPAAFRGVGGPGARTTGVK